MVDDDKQIVEALSIQLKKEGFEVLVAYDGWGALDVLSAGGVDLLLIDVMMPKMDGFFGDHEDSGKSKTCRFW